MPFQEDVQQIGRMLETYRRDSQSGKTPVIRQRALPELIRTLRLAERLRDGGLEGGALSAFFADYLADTTRLEHPGYMAHQVSVVHPAGSVAALVDAFTNNPMAIYEMGPAAAAIEFFMINWMLAHVGFQPAPLDPPAAQPPAWGGGVLVNGGSLANLTALIAARTHLSPGVWEHGNPQDLALLAPAECHYSIARAAGILGLGRKAVFLLEVDRSGAVIPERLPLAYERLRRDGKRALALVANACNTPVGIYDPLMEIGAFCRQHGIWFHVDGAHGAAALLSSRYRHLLRGVEGADSVIWDAHKLMRTPPLCAAVLVRDHRHLDRAFEQEASYLFHAKNQPGVDFIHRTVECTKSALGLKLFCVMAALGESGMAAYIERQYDLAAEAYAYLRAQPDLECPVAPQSNIVCFRMPGSDPDQLRFRDRLIASGEFHLSTTMFQGRRYLRMVLMSPQTTIADIKALVTALRRLR